MPIRTNRGFAAIVLVLVVGGMIMVMANGMAFRAHKQVMAAVGSVASAQAKQLANACVEIAIGKLQTILNYAGNESITSNGITCDILAIQGIGDYNRVITARASVNGYVRKVAATITKISFPIVISSWKDIPN